MAGGRGHFAWFVGIIILAAYVAELGWIWFGTYGRGTVDADWVLVAALAIAASAYFVRPRPTDRRVLPPLVVGLGILFGAFLGIPPLARSGLLSLDAAAAIVVTSWLAVPPTVAILIAFCGEVPPASGSAVQ